MHTEIISSNDTWDHFLEAVHLMEPELQPKALSREQEMMRRNGRKMQTEKAHRM